MELTGESQRERKRGVGRDEPNNLHIYSPWTDNGAVKPSGGSRIRARWRESLAGKQGISVIFSIIRMDF